MTDEPDSEAPDPIAPAEDERSPRWPHSHVAFVLAVLTRYRIAAYKDKEVHRGHLAEGIESWDDEDRRLAIDEGRRQLDAQFTQLQHVIRRASVLLPVGLAASIFFLKALEDVAMMGQPTRTIVRVLLLAGVAMTIWGTLIMGALIGARSSFMKTDTLQLTEEPSGLQQYLARDYAKNVVLGENTNAARLTHLGTGVVWIVIGAFLGAVGLAVIYWQPATLPPLQPVCSLAASCTTGN